MKKKMHYVFSRSKDNENLFKEMGERFINFTEIFNKDYIWGQKS